MFHTTTFHAVMTVTSVLGALRVTILIHYWWTVQSRKIQIVSSKRLRPCTHVTQGITHSGPRRLESRTRQPPHRHSTSLGGRRRGRGKHTCICALHRRLQLELLLGSPALNCVIDRALEGATVREMRLDHHVLHFASEKVDDFICGLLARCGDGERPACGLGVRFWAMNRMKLSVDLLSD